MTETEWENLVRAHQRRVFSIALSVLRNVEDAKEITQDVFMKLYIHLDTLRDSRTIPAWLARTSYTTAISKQRLSRIKHWILGEEEFANTPSPEASAESALCTSQLQQKLTLWRKARLSEKENVILQLKHGDEMTLQEIAELLKINISSVKTHYYRALQKLENLRDSNQEVES